MNARVLIIDDDRDLAAMLGEFLQREGYSVEAHHGADAGVAALRWSGRNAASRAALVSTHQAAAESRRAMTGAAAHAAAR